MDTTTARLLITCPDRPGIVAAVSGFLMAHGANIIDLDQHSTGITETGGGEFFMRLEFHHPRLDIAREAMEEAFGRTVADRFTMDWRMAYPARKKRLALFVSRQGHALMEILWRLDQGDLPGEAALVVSNHPTLRRAVEAFAIPYHHVPVTPETKDQAEAEHDRLIQEAGAEVIVLARYMQIVSPAFCARHAGRIINIHHSFLPAFVGADPYRRAHERGVKLIGATAHYVTEELDGGPIIEQDVVRVTHRSDVADLVARGRDIERQVLARAVRWHLEDRILPHGDKTVVFKKE